MTRRSWTQRPGAREAQRQGCRLTARYPRRQVVDRLLWHGLIVADLLECGHVRHVESDRVRQFTRTRRCDDCFHAGIA